MTKRVFSVDQNGYSVETLSYAVTASLAFAAASDRVALPSGVIGDDEILRLACNQHCYVTFGDSSVTASSSDVYFPAGVETVKVPTGATHIAAIRETDDGIMSITELI